ncbi:MAG: type I DNA topoisomerase [Candidatus Sericytochromatia bacterium]
MTKSLVIVESPAKAKTIEGYLGKDFKVASSYGHVRDLPKDDKAIDIKNGFKPTYQITDDKKQVISDLKKLVKNSEIVYLASDDDREGEAISWHLKEALNLKDNNTKRIVFREITKNAILNAIQNPRTIDIDLVNAQQARRVLDRLVGFELSPVLWKKIKVGLSAGRVQSVAVRMVVEREREIDKFNSKSAFKVTASFDLGNGKLLKAELGDKFEKESDAKAFLEKCKDANFSIDNLEKKPVKKSPAPPFTTSTLQQEASIKLGYSVSQTMTLAQKLYEAGKISYMRTDSLNLSEEAISKAVDSITKQYGKNFVETRKYKTKSESAQEAHEAIRPTDFSVQQAGEEGREQKLYELIWKRAIASQMADAKLERTIATIGISNQKEKLIASGEVILFEGFLKVYIESSEDDDDESKSVLPPLNIGQKLILDFMKARETFSKPAARYTEASLVKKLEEMGIGRPSTYAPTISTIIKREYVVKESREGRERKYKEITLKNKKIETLENKEITGTEKNKLFPTNIGMIVNDFLVEYFNDIIDYSFTANVEKEFDDIANGKKVWNKMIDNFYGGFHSKVETTSNIDRSEINSGRELGIDPVSGKKVIARLGRFGALVQIGETTDEEKPKYGRLKKGQFIESITLEEALELFKLPREIGEYESQTMTVAIGRFGPYIKHDNKFYSLTKEDDPMTITEERGIEIINAKRKADAEKLIKSFDETEDVKVLNGRFGPYIKVGAKNVKIPKGKNPQDITLEECLEWAESVPDKPSKKSKVTSKNTKATTKTTKAAKTSKAKSSKKDDEEKVVKKKTSTTKTSKAKKTEVEETVKKTVKKVASKTTKSKVKKTDATKKKVAKK